MRLRGTKMSNQGHCALLLARVLLAEIPSLSVFHTGLKKKKKKKKATSKAFSVSPWKAPQGHQLFCWRGVRIQNTRPRPHGRGGWWWHHIQLGFDALVKLRLGSTATVCKHPSRHTPRELIPKNRRFLVLIP